jgi:hypothetical protein
MALAGQCGSTLLVVVSVGIWRCMLDDKRRSGPPCGTSRCARVLCGQEGEWDGGCGRQKAQGRREYGWSRRQLDKNVRMLHVRLGGLNVWAG